MSVRTLLAALASTLVLAGCQTPAEEPEPSGPLLAFRSATEIGLVQGTSVIATAPGKFAPTGEPILTADGRFVFSRTDGGLAVLDTESHAARTVAARTGDRLGTGGGGTVVWVEEPDRLMQLDLTTADPAPTLRRTLDVPAGELALIASRGDTAVVADRNAPQTLYSVHAAEPPKPLGDTGANTPVELAVLSPDADSVAYAVYRGSNLDCGRAALTMVSLKDASLRTINVGQRDRGFGARVLHLWWTGITPELSTAEWNCADPEIGTLPTVSEVRGLGLHPALQGEALHTVDLGPGVTATLVPSAATPRERYGMLVVDVEGEKKGVQGDVSAIAAVS